MRRLVLCDSLKVFHSLSVCLALIGVPASGAAPDDGPVIATAAVDYAARRVTLSGANFSPAGSAPTVSYENVTLDLLSFTDRSASVKLPDDWVSGSRLLAVTNSNHQTGEYRVTLAAAAPLSASGKLAFHAHALFGPLPILGTLAYAGLLQEFNAPTEWGQGWDAYGKRVASTEAVGIIHGVLAFGLDASLHEDPRYFRSNRKGAWHRIAHAARETILTHTDSGRETLSCWRLGSAYGAAFISNLWYPDRLDTVALGFEQGSLRMGFDLVTNITTEFWPDIKKKLRRHK